MTTFIRLCLSIILGTATLALIIVLLSAANELYSGYRIASTLRNTTCAKFISVAEGSDQSAKAYYSHLAYTSDSRSVEWFDPKLGANTTNFRVFVGRCVAKPAVSMRDALVGYNDDDIADNTTQVVADERTKLNAAAETEQRRNLLNADYTTPYPASTPSPTTVSATAPVTPTVTTKPATR